MAKYRYKATIDAIQWTGDNYDEVCKFVGKQIERDAHELINGEPALLILDTGEGFTMVSISDYITKHELLRTFSVSKAGMFEALYEKVEEHDKSNKNIKKEYAEPKPRKHY